MSTPALPETNNSPRLAWEESIWFSDIDDTLIDTAGISVVASDGIRRVSQAHFGEAKAAEIRANFNDLFALMMAGYRVRDEVGWQQVSGGKAAFEDLVSYFEKAQQPVIDKYGHYKKWSREIFIKAAAEKAGEEVSPELVQEAADAYWLTLTEHTEIFPDALKLSEVIHDHQRPLFLVTSSDARLKMQPDGQFTYDPLYSESLKRRRIELLRDKGLHFNAISIGDPEDKPHPDFFNKALRLAETELGIQLDPHKSLMLGDSFTGDLQTPKEQMGFGLVVLREKGRSSTTVDDEHQVTLGNLEEVERFLV